MTYSKLGDVRLRMETETDVSRDERIRRGVKYSSPKPPTSETLALESLRDQAIAARIRRAAKRKPASNAVKSHS